MATIQNVENCWRRISTDKMVFFRRPHDDAALNIIYYTAAFIREVSRVNNQCDFDIRSNKRLKPPSHGINR